MKLELSEKFVNILTELPETGMGYQIVNITLKNGSIASGCTVYNSSVLELEGRDIKNDDIESISMDA